MQFGVASARWRKVKLMELRPEMMAVAQLPDEYLTRIRHVAPKR